jgi:hypothetical protein
MQAGKAAKQPPTHTTGDTAHADSTAVCTRKSVTFGPAEQEGGTVAFMSELLQLTALMTRQCTCIM